MGGGGVTRYTVILDAEQLELVGLALRYLRAEVEADAAALRPEHRELVESRAAETLGALKTTRKPVRTPKPRAAVIAEPVFDTGDAALDAFMREHWSPSDVTAAAKRRAAALPTATHLKPRAMTPGQKKDLARFNEVAIREWKRRGYEVIIDPKPAPSGVSPSHEPYLDGRNVRILPRAGS